MKKALHRSSDKRLAGSALVIAMVAISGLAVVSMTLIQYSLAVDRERADDSSDASAHYLAESAIHEAATSLSFGGTGSLGSEAAPVGFADGLFWTDTTDLGDGLWSIRATAMAGKGRRTLEAVVELAASGSIGAGLFSEEKIFLGKGIFADSYDSDLGTYASQAKNTKGKTKYARANSRIVTDGDLNLKKGLEIFGDLQYGYKDKLKAEKGALEEVVGDVEELDSVIDYPAVSAPAAPPSLGKVHLHGDAKSKVMDLVIGPGRVRYESLTIHKDAKVKFVGPVTIVVDKKFKLDSSLTVDTTAGPVAMWVGDSLHLQKKAAMTVTSGKPADFFALVGTKTDKKGKKKKTKVKLDAAFTGVIYAPHSKVDIKKNAEIYGAMIAHEIKMKKGVRFHYDEALGRMNSNLLGEPELRLVSLRTVEFDGDRGPSDRRDPLTLLRLGGKALTRIDRSWTVGEGAQDDGDGLWGEGDMGWIDDEEWWPDDDEEAEEDWDELDDL